MDVKLIYFNVLRFIHVGMECVWETLDIKHRGYLKLCCLWK